MSVQTEQLPITSPCPITLEREGISAQDKQMFCAHCTKDVHLLSNMRENEVRALLRDRAGDDICVSYAMQKNGSIRFADSKDQAVRVQPTPALVPVTHLRRRSASHSLVASLAASVAVIGTSAILAGCTPHAESEVQTDAQAEPSKGHLLEGPREREVEEIVDGGIRAEPLGEILPESPCPSPLDEELNQEPLPLAAGGIRAMPLPEQHPPEPPPEQVRGRIHAPSDFDELAEGAPTLQ